MTRCSREVGCLTGSPCHASEGVLTSQSSQSQLAPSVSSWLGGQSARLSVVNECNCLSNCQLLWQLLIHHGDC